MVGLNIWSIPTRQGWDLQHLENRSAENTAQLPSNPRPATADLGEAYCSIAAGKLGQDWEKQKKNRADEDCSGSVGAPKTTCKTVPVSSGACRDGARSVCPPLIQL